MHVVPEHTKFVHQANLKEMGAGLQFSRAQMGTSVQYCRD
jgi:hypothetical protein